MKKLFHPKWHSYNEKASELDDEVRKVMEPIIDKWLNDGYSPRDIESIIHSAVDMTICFKHMYRNAELMKAERNERQRSSGKKDLP